MPIKIIITSLLLLSLLNACSLTPQKRSKTPHFNGTLMFSGKPINQANIMLSSHANDTLCLKAKHFTNTNKQGQFSLNAVIENSRNIPFVNFQFNEWTLCARYNDNIFTLHTNNQYGTGNVTGAVSLKCDFALRPVSNPCTTSRQNTRLK